MDQISRRDVINKVFQLAYFIHGDRAVALQITAAVMRKQELAATAQDKRLYYKPGGRLLFGKVRSDPFRTKVFLNEVHLLQRLVYIESEVYERQREQLQPRAGLSEEDMIIRFIKHLVRITIKRNSFYVALGLSRLLFNYKTSETMEIYNLVVQDPDRVKDDCYYRSRKGRLIQEMKDRFGGFIDILRGPRGEERFQTRPHSQRYIDLVRKCLSLFTMWDTPCLVPACLDSTADMPPRFSFIGADPDLEPEIEINRMHALLHPDCYRKVTDALRFDSPESRLEVPKFNIDQYDDQSGMRDGRQELLELKEEELAFINDSLAKQSARRRMAASGLLRVMVDGNERARIDLNQTNDARFDVDENAELIEVCAEDSDGEIPLAMHLLTDDEILGAHDPSKFSITLEGNQRLSFIISPLSDIANETGGASVRVSYQEMASARGALRFIQRQRSRLPELLRDWSAGSLAKPAVAFAFLILCAAAALLFISMPKPRLLEAAQGMKAKREIAISNWSLNSTQPGPKQVPSSPGEFQDKNSSSAPSTLIAKGRTPQQKKQVIATGKTPGESAVPPSGHQLPETDPGETEATRSERIKFATISLPRVKSLYVEPRGDESLSRAIQNLLNSKLELSKRFSIAQSVDEADAALKLTVSGNLVGGKPARDERRRNAKRRNAESIVVIAKVVDGSGNVIWPLDNLNKGRKYNGRIESIADKFTSDLLTDVRRLENKR